MSIPGKLCTNTTHGSGWMIPMLSTRPCNYRPGIPPTAVRGWFRSFLRRPLRCDGIPPTVVGGMVQILSKKTAKVRWNPTNGSWWMVQILSKKTAKVRWNPTNGSWWMVQILSRKTAKVRWNPTNGSWWMVQIPIEISTHCRGWDYGWIRKMFCRKELNKSTHCRGWDSQSVSGVNEVCKPGVVR